MKCKWCHRIIKLHKGVWCEVREAAMNRDVFYMPLCMSLCAEDRKHLPDTEAVAIWKEQEWEQDTPAGSA